MSDQILDGLTARIEKLERQNRWLRRAGVAAVALGLCGGAAAQTLKSAPVVADRFTLVDTMDRARAVLDNRLGTASSSPVLTFFDEQGKPRLRLGLGPRGALLETIDEHGKTADFFGPPAVRPATQ
jgi:hypothetical protein